MNEQIIAAGMDLFHRLEAYGYNTLTSAAAHIDIPNGDCRISIICSDDFQKDAEYKDYVQNGYQTFYLENGAFVIPAEFKTREERELHFMARRFGKGKEIADQMVSAAGRAFALKMEQELASLRTMITEAR
ncbi:MAG: hypothetical protein HC888_05260 [Candidatus Competibacteraceae bacterium]|nr:hypothetical protein [Candidatus Competibacteraceae bacterium]